jgi:hypothetical protein
MFFNNKKKSQKQLDELCSKAEIFVQVHYVRERSSDRYKFNILTLKDDPERQKVAEWLEEHGNPTEFSAICLLFLNQSGKEESVICDRAGLEKGYFGKLRNSTTFHPSKPEAVSLCLAMKLNIEESRLLLKSAGYALTNSEKPDLIIRYFIENNLYHIDDLNYVLDKLCSTTLEGVKE